VTRARPRWRRWRRDEHGGVVVEFALVLPLVILPVLAAILQYGYQYWSLETAAATAREAARQLAVGTDPACVTATARDLADSPAVGPVTVTTSPATPRDGELVTVTVSFPSLDLHLLPLPNGGVVTQSADARVQRARAGTAGDPYLPC
jgi:Flp pilus assembly protein TadG